MQKLTPGQALLKLANYCAYQERCHNEVLEKLASYGVYGDDANAILLQLIEQNYLNEERFAIAFAGGKFRTKKWGRNRIIQELKSRHISPYCINKALHEIDDETYYNKLSQLVAEKYHSLKDRNKLIKGQKTARYLIGKGYEADLVWSEIKKLQ